MMMRAVERNIGFLSCWDGHTYRFTGPGNSQSARFNGRPQEA